MPLTWPWRLAIKPRKYAKGARTLNRRDFLKTSAITAAGIIANHVLSKGHAIESGAVHRPQQEENDMKDILRPPIPDCFKVYAINGSPRKHRNTGTLLEKALEGAASNGARTKLVHLYDYNYKGCLSCFSCKRLGGSSIGRCVVRDDLTPLLDELIHADAIILGTPLYYQAESGMMRSFFERFHFPYLTYSWPLQTRFPRPIRTAMIYTMNMKEEHFQANGFESIVRHLPNYLGMIIGPCEKMIVSDTLQFDDYSKYENTLFNSLEKMTRHKDTFPKDAKRAFELGKLMTLPLTEDERASVMKSIPTNRNPSAIPCTGCRQCEPCPVGVAIPDVFEGYDQFTVSENHATFINAIDSLGSNSGPTGCIDCGVCLKKCPQKIDIPSEMKTIKKELLKS